ncbi:hypothetical protein A6D6_00105 [Alcanivorax xiamenensis]|uniref:Ribosomal RNA small subunit methyltransferase E n=2 Tax=Alcanivoracaceae TaxID=224372 RepID=A0ABQ6YDF5_9GAMM|nr:hypothetical protein A6D6_00105 [Alcanivorax xiamenensis]
MRRFFDDQEFHLDRPCQLGANASQHIARVLRMTEGEEVVLFNGHGGEWRARLCSVGKKTVEVLPLAHDPMERTPPLAVTLGLPMIKGERMDYAIQKATELGVARIRILDTARCEVRLKGERQDKKRDHWRQVAISACEQCGLNRPPEILAAMPLKHWLAGPLPGLKLIAHPGSEPFAPESLRRQSELTLLTGPEGGFDDDELDSAFQAGFSAFALGSRVLRAETAPVALLAALWAWLS